MQLAVVYILSLCLFIIGKGGTEGVSKPQLNDYQKYKLLVYTVATDETDGYKRYLRSTSAFKIQPIVLGLDQEWSGGDVRRYPGGGQKVNLLRRALRDLKRASAGADPNFLRRHLIHLDGTSASNEPLKVKSRSPDIESNRVDGGQLLTKIDDDDGMDKEEEDLSLEDFGYDKLIILFTDSYDVLYNANASDIVRAFLSTQSGILFSSEAFCWPDTSLAVLYPETRWKNKYLNSGAFMGFYDQFAELLRILPSRGLEDGNKGEIKKLTDDEDNLLESNDDDQLFYTNAFLDKELRKKLNINLDYENVVFINLNGFPPEELKIVAYGQLTEPGQLDKAKSFATWSEAQSAIFTVQNLIHNNIPLIIHGNGDSKITLNYLSNYIPLAHSSYDGCTSCQENTLNLRNKPLTEYPIVFLHVHVDKPTPFFRQFLMKLYSLDYPKNKIILDFYSNLVFHDNLIGAYLNDNSKLYLATDWYRNIYTDDVARKADNARDFILHRYYTNTYKPDYFFNVDSECHLDNPKTLILLIEQNRPILAPMLARPGKMWTNFWGALSSSGYYARSENYVDIVTYKQLGLFNVPFIASCYLIHRPKIEEWYATLSIPLQPEDASINHANLQTIFPEPLEPTLYLKGDFQSVEEHQQEMDSLLDGTRSKKDVSSPDSDQNQPRRLVMYIAKRLDNDMAFCKNLRYNGDFMYVTNLQVYGHLIDYEYYETNHLHNDLYSLFENPKDWEETYIHPDWRKVLSPEYKVEEPCPDVYWFPVLTDQFCDELVEEVDNSGEWSGGKHEDKRLAGGYENVPTDDIHMKQVGLERHWLHFLKLYISPMQVKLYPGYHHDPPEAIMNFVVRYKPTIQAFLRPHHDSSTYTINVALNHYNKEYTGGGVRFIRYNCSVIETRKGWTFIHPGRLTHYHEGLLITNGTRYLMVSFVDP